MLRSCHRTPATHSHTPTHTHIIPYTDQKKKKPQTHTPNPSPIRWEKIKTKPQTQWFLQVKSVVCQTGRQLEIQAARRVSSCDDLAPTPASFPALQCLGGRYCKHPRDFFSFLQSNVLVCITFSPFFLFSHRLIKKKKNPSSYSYCGGTGSG